MEVVPNVYTSTDILMSTAHTRLELNIAKRLHRSGHATVDGMKTIMSRTGLEKSKIGQVCEKVYDASPICAGTGRPAMRRKISTLHINEAFNEELQVGFLYVVIHGGKHEVLNWVNVGTRYGERLLTGAYSNAEIRNGFEMHWFYRHRAPR